MTLANRVLPTEALWASHSALDHLSCAGCTKIVMSIVADPHHNNTDLSNGRQLPV